ncbi:hypothetical protein BDZ45DRAFT_749049 [Acephala macrosclerotiorum]|nr:hypothetical protein BDZ45DRAFT_749049 [Acephala macrosclerotiorum]
MSEDRNRQPSSGPPPLCPVDLVIKQHCGSSSAIEATQERLQASKKTQMPSLSERIEQLQRENSALKYEVAYYRAMESPRIEFVDKMRRVDRDFRRALATLGESQRRVDRE